MITKEIKVENASAVSGTTPSTAGGQTIQRPTVDTSEGAKTILVG